MSTTGQALVKQVRTIEEVMMDRSSIERFKTGIGELERWLTAEKLARVALTAVLQNSDLLECDPRTILAATLQLGQVGLLPDGFLGQAYLVPFNNSVKLANGQYAKQMQATSMIGYRGFGELISRSGKANSHDAQVVFSNDEFDFAMGSEPYIRHVRKLGQRGDPIASYAIVYMKEGPARFEIMDMEELNKIKGNSRGSSRSDSPWKTWWEEMARKTPVRRLAKYVPLSPEFQRASSIDEGAELGYSKFDEKRGEYVIEPPAAKEEKPPIQQPQREGAIIVGEKPEVTEAAVTTDAGKGQPTQDGTAVASSSNQAEQVNSASTERADVQQQLGQEAGGASAPAHSPSEEPDPYHKRDNPNGKHISVMQHKRLFGILHSAQEMVKNSGKGKALSDAELRQYVQSKGWTDERFIPYHPREMYEQACVLAGGDQIKISNGGQ